MLAPRAKRRPGHSRRAQLGLFVAYVAAVGAAIIGLFLIILAAVDPVGFGIVRGAATDASAPVSSVLRRGVMAVTGADDAVSAYLDAGAQNIALRRQLAAAHVRLVEARATEFENRRLRAMLKIVQPRNDVVAVARVVSSTATSDRRIATLTAGLNDGVRPGQPVRAPEGLVGRVLDTGRSASRVLLLTDETNSVPVREVRRGTPGIVTGDGTGGLDIRALGTGPMPFRRGDLLVTSGAGGLYAPGIPVAVVALVGADGARALPLARPERLDVAAVLPAYRPPLLPAPAAGAKKP